MYFLSRFFNHPHHKEKSHQNVNVQAQNFSEDHLSKEDRYIYEPLEDFSKVYEEVSQNKSSLPNQEPDGTNAVSKTDDGVTVPTESLQEELVPISSNDHSNTVYEAVTPEETPSLMSAARRDDHEVGKKMESELSSTTEQALTCYSEGNNYEKVSTTDDNQAYEATTAL